MKITIVFVWNGNAIFQIGANEIQPIRVRETVRLKAVNYVVTEIIHDLDQSKVYVHLRLEYDPTHAY